MSAVPQPALINEDKMNAFLGKVVGDFGAALSSSLVYIGQKLGLYKALAAGESFTPAELAETTSTNERYVREWLINQAASGYVDYDPASARFSLSPEQKVALTDETSPFYVGGGFYVIKAMTQAASQIEGYFKNGGGMLWGDHDPDLFVGTERFFRPGYAAHLIASWIPSLTGIEAKLKAGGKVADVGCAMVLRRSSWPRLIPTRASGASTITRSRLLPHANELRRLALRTGLRSQYRMRVRYPTNSLIWLLFSIAFTTWAIRLAPANARLKCWRRRAAR